MKNNSNKVLWRGSKRQIVLSVLMMLFVAVSAQPYKNPVLPGFHPDPSVCRVGDDFYLVNSSFQYFPGVPIYTSKDLIHWRQIGNVLNREEQLPLKGASTWTGIYAPTIRYDNGTFYMITTNVGGGGNFMVTAKNPSGPWSKPIWLKQQGIDPSLYFENGKCYMVSNPDDTICMCEINPKTGEQLTESKPLWQGTGGRYPEGPHIYKKDGYYYLLISEGGTEYGHQLSIARSRNIYGPYESNPANPILCHQRRITQSSIIQGTGHGDFVQAADGSWWVTFLGFRTYGGNYHHLGRETFMAPVKWDEGAWPIVNGNGTVDTLMNVRTLPQTPMVAKREKISFDTLDYKFRNLGPEWVYIQNPVEDNYKIAKGKLRLIASLGKLEENNRPTFIGRRQESPTFFMETCMQYNSYGSSNEAGLTIYQTNDCHFDLCVEDKLGVTKIKVKYHLKGLSTEIVATSFYHSIVLVNNQKVYLRIRGTKDTYEFSYSQDNVLFWQLGEISTSLLSSEVTGGFTGVMLGMYCISTEEQESYQPKTYADFSYFRYREDE